MSTKALRKKIMDLVQQLDYHCYQYGKYKTNKDIQEHLTQIHTTIKPLADYEAKINKIKEEIECLLTKKKK